MNLEVKRIFDETLDELINYYGICSSMECSRSEFTETFRETLWTLSLKKYCEISPFEIRTIDQYKKFFQDNGIKTKASVRGPLVIPKRGYYFLLNPGFCCCECLLVKNTTVPIPWYLPVRNPLSISPNRLLWLMNQFFEYRPKITKAIKGFERNRLLYIIRETIENSEL